MLLLWLIKASLLLCAGLLFSKLRVCSAALRHLVLQLCLVGVVVLLIAEWVAPAPMFVFNNPELLDLTVLHQVEVVPEGEATPKADARSGLGLSLPSALWLAYGCVALLLLARLLVRVRRVASQVEELEFLDGAQTLKINPDPLSPFAWGVTSACVVVPADWSSWEPAKRRSVLLHEHAHLRRLDPLSTIASGVLCALFWFHPLVWLARKRLGFLAEQACDDVVINHGIATTTYAQHLIDISRMQASQLAPSISAPSQLSGRIKLLLDQSTRRQPMTVYRSLTVFCMTALFVAMLANVGLAAQARAQTQTDLPGVRAALVTKLTTVQVHIDDEAYADAFRNLREAREIADLNDNERAQIANMSGYAHFRATEYGTAIDEYKRVLQAESIPQGLRLTTLYTLAQLSFLQEADDDAIAYMRRWMALAENPGHIPRVFLAQTYYRSGDYTQALQELEAALAQAEAAGARINPNWKKLHEYLLLRRDGADPGRAPLHSGVDGDYYPIAKVQPMYPRAARQQKIEGYVVVEFSVGTEGETLDHRVVDAHPPEIFDRAALAAVEKFKYKPRVEAGKPVVVTGVRNKLTFKL